LNAAYYRIKSQIHRGIPRQNRNLITQVMVYGCAVLGSNSESLGNREKSNMKMGEILDPLWKEIFKCRLL